MSNLSQLPPAIREELEDLADLAKEIRDDLIELIPEALVDGDEIAATDYRAEIVTLCHEISRRVKAMRF